MQRLDNLVELIEFAHLLRRVAALTHLDGSLPACLVGPLRDTELAACLAFPELEEETRLRGLDDKVRKEGFEGRHGGLVEEAPPGKGTMVSMAITTNANSAAEGLCKEVYRRGRCDLSGSYLDSVVRVDHALHSSLLDLEGTITVHHSSKVR